MTQTVFILDRVSLSSISKITKRRSQARYHCSQDGVTARDRKKNNSSNGNILR